MTGEGPRDVVTISARQLKHIRWAIRGLLLAVLTLAAVVGMIAPRSLSYGELLDENQSLKIHLARIDRQMAEVDRLLLRLRLYDSQIRSLAEPDGDHGPLPPDTVTTIPLAGSGPDLFGGPDLSGHPPVTPSDLRPAEAWAVAVGARVELFLAVATSAEPDLTEVVTELEDLRALESALPSAWPATGQMTSGFGWRRSPFGRSWRFHSGLDIANDRGTPIYAASSGEVIKAYYNAGYGKMLEIDHGFGITSTYAHCNSLRVKVGDEVERGDYIGTIGSTGRSTGPHLHFEVRLDGHPVDPLDYLPR